MKKNIMKSERVLLTRTPSSISILASILPYPLLSLFIPAILYCAAVVYVYPAILYSAVFVYVYTRHLVFCCFCLCLSPPSCILLLLSLRYTFKMSLSHWMFIFWIGLNGTTVVGVGCFKIQFIPPSLPPSPAQTPSPPSPSQSLWIY